MSSISFVTAVPGIQYIMHKSTLVKIAFVINADLRHLYLSVITPIAGLISNPGIGIIEKIKPTIPDEYPRCFDTVVKNGIIEAAPEGQIKALYQYIYCICIIHYMRAASMHIIII